MTKKEKIITYTWLTSIVIILAVGVFLFFQRPGSSVIKAHQELVEMSRAIRNHYKNKPDYWGLSTGEVVKNKLYSGNLNNNQIINSLGKKVIIGADIQGSSVMPGMHSYMIAYKDLNKKECVELTSFSWKEEDILGLISITIQNEEETQEFNWGNQGLPVSRNKVKQFCKEKNNTMWFFE